MTIVKLVNQQISGETRGERARDRSEKTKRRGAPVATIVSTAVKDGRSRQQRCRCQTLDETIAFVVNTFDPRRSGAPRQTNPKMLKTH